jgi:hypothetical protein
MRRRQKGEQVVTKVLKPKGIDPAIRERFTGIAPETREVFETPPFRPVMETPCAECPFRRASMAGWLGRSPPEEFVQLIGFEYPMPCHLSVDYEDKKWREKWEAGEIGKLCRGALIYARNSCKRFDNRALPTLPADRENFFSNPMEFVKHHRSGKAKSWDEEEAPSEERSTSKRKRKR